MQLKFFALLFIHTVLSGMAFSQFQMLVIDTNQTNLLITEINDTLWNSPPYQYMSLDIDVTGDGVYDLVVSCDGYQGSAGDESEMWLKGSSSTEYVLDTLVIDSVEHYGLPGNLFIVDTFQLVYKYSYGDTLYAQAYFTDEEHYMVHTYNYPPGMFGPGARLYLNDWVGGDNYIGFKAVIYGNIYLGWLKVEVKYGTVIIVKESALYDPELSVIENPAAAAKIYPNPATWYFQIETRDFHLLEVFTTDGISVLKSPLPRHSIKSINCGSLSPGLYIVRLSNARDATTQKLVIH